MTPKTSTSRHELVAQPHLAWLKGLGNAAIDLLFPPRCVACHRLGAWLCADCIDEIEIIQPPVCLRCGLPLSENATASPAQPQTPQSGCTRCRQTPLQLDGLSACAIHDGPLRKAITQLKYRDLRALAFPLGKLMGDCWATLSPPDIDIDVIVPVPLHAARLRERGYNQAGLLANELGSHLQKPVVEDAMMRIKETKPQTDLDAQARRENVQEAFQCVRTTLAGKRVLLVDDVCTTGSTLNAASDALQAANVSFVWAYTLTRAKGDSGSVSNKT